MANICRGLECRVEVVVDVDCQGFGLDITIVALIHIFHGYDIRTCYGGAYKGVDKHDIFIKSRREEVSMYSLYALVIQLSKHILCAKHRSKLPQRLYNTTRFLQRGCREKEFDGLKQLGNWKIGDGFCNVSEDLTVGGG